MTSSSASLDYAVIDVFSSKRFHGNPAAVVTHSTPLEEALYKEIAREFNQPMTAFVTPFEDTKVPRSDSRSFRLRWFTASMEEVTICGHATLAAAVHLFRVHPEIVPPHINHLNFLTLSGNLTALRIGDKVELEFPSGELKEPDQELATTASNVLGRAIKGAKLDYIGEGLGSFAHFIVFVLKEGSTLEGIEVDTTALLELPHMGVTITVKSSQPGVHFISRTFLPRVGIAEDSVSGSPHCLLGPYWIKRLGLGKGSVLSARQASERGGEIDVVWDEDKGMCKLRGKAMTVAKGTMFLA